jgi:hypothetical protein
MRKNKGIIIALVVILVIIGLFVWGNSLQKDRIVNFGDTEIACLTNGHQRVAEHIHPALRITVDGNPEEIPADIGITPVCMSELHTHDTTGTIHVESVSTGRIDNFHLGDFFSVWGESHTRDGYDLEITQDGEKKNSVEEVKFIDKSVIELKYTSRNSEEEVQ